MSVDLVKELRDLVGTLRRRRLYRSAEMATEAAAELERLRAMLDEVATSSTHPDRDGPGCWWCIAEAGQPHEAGCKYAALTGGPQ